MQNNIEIMDKQEAKLYLLYLLKKIFEITEHNNIPIYAIGGTCLGMIREKGMIPWDDDIDLAIFRKDYDRFVKACEVCLEKPVVLRTRDNDPYYCQEFAKVCLIDDNGNYTDLSIDIFELDETNPNRKLFREIQNKIKSYLYYLKLYQVSKMGFGKYEPNSFLKKIVLSLGCCLRFDTINKLLLKTMTAENECGDYVVNWGGAYSYKKETYPKKAFGVPQKFPFENTYIWSGEHPEMIMEIVYGDDYMTPPPPEKRINHKIRKFECKALELDTVREKVEK